MNIPWSRAHSDASAAVDGLRAQEGEVPVLEAGDPLVNDVPLQERERLQRELGAVPALEVRKLHDHRNFRANSFGNLGCLLPTGSNRRIPLRHRRRTGAGQCEQTRRHCENNTHRNMLEAQFQIRFAPFPDARPFL